MGVAVDKYRGTLVAIVALSMLMSSALVGAGSSADKPIYTWPLEELMQLRIADPASLTALKSEEAAASITVITARDIELTPARNLYDLIETYVPGAIWMNYEEGPQLGIRGLIANRNYRYLLRVNGRAMNSKGHYGAKSELEQWNLEDIERIEIVRGPGSVIYGPGAVAGVINIITTTAASAPGTHVSAKYVDHYDSKSISIRHGHTGEALSALFYASITETDGYRAPHFFVTNDGEAGYVGKTLLPDSEPLSYYSDYQNNPQLKLHLDVDFLENWRFWARYTQQGSTWKGNETKTLFGDRLVNQQGIRDRQWTGTLEYDRELSDSVSAVAMVSVDSLDVERRIGDARHPDPGHALNKKLDFSETELLVRGILNWRASEPVEIAVGVEYSRDDFGPGWGDSKRDMRLGEDGVIVNGPNSNAISPGSRSGANKNNNALFVGDGWDTDTYSVFSEANIACTPWLRCLLSGRVDKNTYSEWLFSPRVVLLGEINEHQSVKLIAQQAQRMGTAGQLYALDANGNDPDKETMDGVEVIYSAFNGTPFSFSVASFWNDVGIIAWNQDSQETTEVGDLQLFGVEPQLVYRWSGGRVGASYSYIKQLDWELAEGVPSSGVSYADYDQPLGDTDAILTGTGNDLNNWPNQALKIHARFSLSEKVLLHVDARYLWDYQGAKDGLRGLANAVSGQPEEADVNAAIQAVDVADAYDYDFRLNAALDYAVAERWTLQLFAQNLLGANDYKRYSYDTGNDRASPKRARFTEEPSTVGMKVSCLF